MITREFLEKLNIQRNEEYKEQKMVRFENQAEKLFNDLLVPYIVRAAEKGERSITCYIPEIETDSGPHLISGSAIIREGVKVKVSHFQGYDEVSRYSKGKPLPRILEVTVSWPGSAY